MSEQSQYEQCSSHKNDQTSATLAASVRITVLALGYSSSLTNMIYLEIQSLNYPHFLLASKSRTNAARVTNSAWFSHEFPAFST